MAGEGRCGGFGCHGCRGAEAAEETKEETKAVQKASDERPFVL